MCAIMCVCMHATWVSANLAVTSQSKYIHTNDDKYDAVFVLIPPDVRCSHAPTRVSHVCQSGSGTVTD